VLGTTVPERVFADFDDGKKLGGTAGDHSSRPFVDESFLFNIEY